MKTLILTAISALLLTQITVSQDQDARRYAIVGGRVLPVEGPVLQEGVILTRGTKIERIGTAKEVDIPSGYEVIDASGLVITPGLVELHNHTGGSDLQSRVYQLNPGSRVVDNMEIGTPALKVAIAGGVSTVLSIPGSATNVSGWGVVRKTWGKTPKDALVRFPGALKIAQAGNPERGGGELGSTNLGMNWLIRNLMAEGSAYHRAWTRFEQGKTKVKPKKVVRLDYIRGLFKKEYPVAVHTQQMAVVQMTMRILHDELGLDVIIDHGTFDGYINASLIAERGIPVANGPRQFWWDRTQGRMLGLAASWHALGIDRHSITVNTDAPVVPQEELIYQASCAVRMGLPEDVALRGLTLNGARMLKIDKRVGSLVAGKDADIVLWTGDPLDPRSRTRKVLINGEVAYDSAKDGIRW
jgi:imidazolonepropionase-like amidohydrolase